MNYPTPPHSTSPEAKALIERSKQSIEKSNKLWEENNQLIIESRQFLEGISKATEQAFPALPEKDPLEVDTGDKPTTSQTIL